MPFFPSKSYNDTPLLPPNQKLESKELLQVCIEANKALAELKAVEKLIPNQTVLINSIPLLESQASSAIENTDELFEHAQITAATSPAIKETLFNYFFNTSSGSCERTYVSENNRRWPIEEKKGDRRDLNSRPLESQSSALTN